MTRYDAARHLVATGAEHGGVRLTLRHKFRDIRGSYLDPDGISRPRDVQDEDEYGNNANMSSGQRMGLSSEDWEDNFLPRSGGRDQDTEGQMIEQTVYVGSPPAPGASYRLVKMGNGCVAMVLVSPPSALLGDTVTSGKGTINTNLNKGPVMDHAARYVASGRGNEPRKLATMNAINKATYRR